MPRVEAVPERLARCLQQPQPGDLAAALPNPLDQAPTEPSSVAHVEQCCISSSIRVDLASVCTGSCFQ